MGDFYFYGLVYYNNCSYTYTNKKKQCGGSLGSQSDVHPVHRRWVVTIPPLKTFKIIKYGKIKKKRTNK
jgi:hypothetical protein